MRDDKFLLNIHKQITDGFENEIFVKDRVGHYIVVNSFYKNKLLSMNVISNKDDVVIGLTDYDLFSKSMADKFREVDELVMSTNEEVVKREVVKIRDNGVKRFISQKKPAYDMEGNVIGVIGSSYEVADIKVDSRNVTLTRREMDCLVGLFFGMTAKEMGTKLSITHRAIEDYIRNIKFKLNCHKKSEIISLILDNNLDKVIRLYNL